MSNQNHPWCRDVSRDAAIRAAEDAAAAERTPLPDHRDLPQAVAELRERVARLTTKHNALVDLARLDAGWVKTQEDCLAAERDAAIRERDAARPDAEHDVREVLAFARLERDAAREECDRLRARVAELESAPAANAGGEQSQPPRGWLTEEERKVLTEVADEAEKSPSKERWAHVASCVRGLLARETPPRVKAPSKSFIILNGESMVDVRDNAWIAAIRDAGGEVE